MNLYKNKNASLGTPKENETLTQRTFFDFRKDLGLQKVFKSPLFSNDWKSWNPGLQKVFKSPLFTNDLKNWNPSLRKVFKSPLYKKYSYLGLQKVFKCPLFINDLKMLNLGLRKVFKSPLFINDLKSRNPGLQKVFKSPLFSNELKSWKTLVFKRCSNVRYLVMAWKSEDRGLQKVFKSHSKFVGKIFACKNILKFCFLNFILTFKRPR